MIRGVFFMAPVRRLAVLARLMTLTFRRVLMASAATLLISMLLLGLLSLMRREGRQALQSDTHTLIVQVAQQLIRMVQSRRATLTFLRDALNRRSDLTFAQLQALGASALDHTRHLIGIGLLQAGQAPAWWAGPRGLTAEELARLNQRVGQRTKLRGAWQVPSTFVMATRRRSFLIMLEPLRASPARRAIIGVFAMEPLLKDFFDVFLPPRHPVQLLDGATILYRSSDWHLLARSSSAMPRQAPPADLSERSEPREAAPRAAPDPKPPRAPVGAEGSLRAGRELVLERQVAVDAERWTIQMQPGSTRVVQILSRFRFLLAALTFLAGLALVVIIWFLAARAWILQRAVARRTAALRRTSRRLRQLAITDELTGLYNRRFFLDRWTWECQRAKRYQRPLACLMIDIDGFKQVNDRLGHHVGDLVLKQVAEELKAMLRHSDVLARLGGDEFVIALPETGAAQAASVAEKLRQVAIAVPEGHRHGIPSVGLSVGVSRVVPGHDDPDELLESADRSLYRCKRGRAPTPEVTSAGVRHGTDVADSPAAGTLRQPPVAARLARAADSIAPTSSRSHERSDILNSSSKEWQCRSPFQPP